jgi:hypothetical protein
MKDYFYLQYQMTQRRLLDAGIHPLIGYLLSLVAFVLVSEYIFHKSEFAKYLVVLICISLQLKLSEKNRADFLLTTFGEQKSKLIRIVENLVLSVPFVVILIYNKAFPECIFITATAFINAAFSFHTNLYFSLPTPFSKSPFEFPVGFRNTFFIFPIAYTLTVIAINVDNLNLGIFSMILIFLTSMSFYSKSEHEYYVWIYADVPKSFLKKKLWIATKSASLLVAPVLIILLIYYPMDFKVIGIFFLLGLMFLWTIILGKYATFPRDMNMPEGLIMALSIYFPPLLLIVIPFFYNKSINKLNVLLYDKN